MSLDAGNPDVECPECGGEVSHWSCDGENAYLAPCGHTAPLGSIQLQLQNDA